MNHFALPKQTIVNKSIPKNAFDSYANTKQKRMFVDLVERIRWINKLSRETLNLPFTDIQEIQIFEIQLRKPDKIQTLLTLIDKAIPYHVIFLLYHKEQGKISVSKKHPHPLNEDNSVIEWTFETDWFELSTIPVKFNLKESIDFVLSDFCTQISGRKEHEQVNLDQVIEKEKKIKELKQRISKLEAAITNSKQFNKKVEMNLILMNLHNELDILNTSL